MKNHTLKKASIAGLDFVCADHRTLVDLINGKINRPTGCSRFGKNLLVTFINPHVSNLSHQHNSIRDFLQLADLVCVDGIGIQIGVLLSKFRTVPRVVAEHLFRIIVEDKNVSCSAILIGTSSSEVIEAQKQINALDRGLNIIDVLDGFATQPEIHNFFSKHHTIPLVLIGAGSPKSESIALQANAICTGSVIFHIGGGTIKTWAGTKRRGPAVVSRLGLEWLHRLIFEPHTRHRYTNGGWLFFKHVFLTRPRRNGDLNNGEIR